MEILPRLTVMDGFELGTGYFINPTPLEMAAQALRDTREVFPLQERQITGVHSYV